jgi:hypothetical protein
MNNVKPDWRPLATTGDQLATYWRPTGDLATWRLGDLLATYWRPLATAGDLCDPQQLRPLWGV